MTPLGTYVFQSLVKAAENFSRKDLERGMEGCSYYSGPLQAECQLSIVETDSHKAFEMMVPMIPEEDETKCLNFLRDRFQFAEMAYAGKHTFFTWRWE